MPQHHEWLAEHLAAMKETPKEASHEAKQKLRALASRNVPDDAIAQEARTVEQAEARLKVQGEKRIRRDVIKILGEFYEKGTTPAENQKAIDHPSNIEVHPKSDHAQRAKYGGVFTTL